MYRVMILANSSGGLFDFRNEVIEACLERGEVIICVPDDVAVDRLQAEGCQVIHTPINRRGMNPIQDFALFRQYSRLLKQYRPDVVLAYTIKPDIYGGTACRFRRIPYMINITGLGTTFERGGMIQRLITVMYKFALRKANCIFFQNAYNREIFRKLGIHGQKDRILNGSGVNLQKHQAVPYPQGESTEFLFVGRIMKEKGIEEYLEAAEKFHSETVKFSILGYCEEAYEEQIRKLEEQDIITFYGFDIQVNRYLESAGAIVVPSYHEGMSNVILEASATARPVLASAISGCQEAVEDGVTGFLFAPRDAQALCRQVERFLQLSPEARALMGQEARAKMEREFDRVMVVKAYMEEINRI